MYKKLLGSAAGCLILLAASCASMQTEIVRDPGKIDSITVGQFKTKDPVDGALFASYLRKELSIQGFTVTEDSPYTLYGVIDFYEMYGSTLGTIYEASIVLKKDSDQIVWRYRDDGFAKKRRDFAKYMAKKIAKQLW